jgi:hypothetical protein
MLHFARISPAVERNAIFVVVPPKSIPIKFRAIL